MQRIYTEINKETAEKLKEIQEKEKKTFEQVARQIVELGIVTYEQAEKTLSLNNRQDAE